jgi:hypothetical protein
MTPCDFSRRGDAEFRADLGGGLGTRSIGSLSPLGSIVDVSPVRMQRTGTPWLEVLALHLDLPTVEGRPQNEHWTLGRFVSSV